MNFTTIRELSESANHWHSILLVENIIVCPSCSKVSDDPFEYRASGLLLGYVDVHSKSEVRHLNREYGDIILSHAFYNDMTAVHTVSYRDEIHYQNCPICAKEVNDALNTYANGVIENNVKKVLRWCNTTFNTRVTDFALYTDKSRIGYSNRIKDDSNSTVFINVDKLDPNDNSSLVENVLSECSKQFIDEQVKDISTHKRVFTEKYYNQFIKETAQIS